MTTFQELLNRKYPNNKGSITIIELENQGTPTGFLDLKDFANAETLKLYGNGINDEIYFNAIQSIANKEKIKIFGFGNNKITNPRFNYVGANFPSLEWMSLGWNPIDNNASFKGLEKCKRLTSLWVGEGEKKFKDSEYLPTSLTNYNDVKTEGDFFKGLKTESHKREIKDMEQLIKVNTDLENLLNTKDLTLAWLQNQDQKVLERDTTKVPYPEIVKKFIEGNKRIQEIKKDFVKIINNLSEFSEEKKIQVLPYQLRDKNWVLLVYNCNDPALHFYTSFKNTENIENELKTTVSSQLPKNYKWGSNVSNKLLDQKPETSEESFIWSLALIWGEYEFQNSPGGNEWKIWRELPKNTQKYLVDETRKQYWDLLPEEFKKGVKEWEAIFAGWTKDPDTVKSWYNEINDGWTKNFSAKYGSLWSSNLQKVKETLDNVEKNQAEQYTDKDLEVFKELGVEDDWEKKECIKECYRLLEIYNKWIKDAYNTDKQVEIRFAHVKKDGSKVNYDKIRGGKSNGVSNVDGSGNHIVHLKLDRYDSDGKFRAGMLWFTMAHELSHCHVWRLISLGKIPFEKIHASHSLNFWKYFLHNSGGFTTNKLFKDNIKDKYWKEYFRNSLPSEFPSKVLIEDVLKVYWPELFLQNVWEKFPQTKKEGVDPSTLTIQKDINVPAKKTDWVWKRLSSGLIELIDEEFKTGKYDKTNIDYIWAKMNVINKEEDEDILIRVGYRKDSFLEKKINELIDTAMGNKEILTLSERQKITNLIGMWFPLVCGNLENQRSMDELVDENFKWISQSSSQLKEIFKEDWSAFMEQLGEQSEIEATPTSDIQYQEAIKAGKKLLEKVNDKTTKALIEVPPKKLN